MDAAQCQAIGEDIWQCFEDLLADLTAENIFYTEEYSGFNFRITVERMD